jgi:hypothetical protein
VRGRNSTQETSSQALLGPMMDKKPAHGELRFDDRNNKTKLANVDESRLEYQINKIRKEGNSSQDNIKNGANKSNKEAEKDKPKTQKQSSFSEKDDKSFTFLSKRKNKDLK